ncbi:hypothetical protein SAMN06295912_10356 [Sphingomonas laterariae]|uniref:Lipoprotein n=1 Tax=Edaphosphingomonas laterariae TaxID=861865 RepID=A0A239CVH4_9SPHN|nr:hypothetical protein SAMN06295912_10356 [Sphingomonas laterariae]
MGMFAKRLSKIGLVAVAGLGLSACVYDDYGYGGVSVGYGGGGYYDDYYRAITATRPTAGMTASIIPAVAIMCTTVAATGIGGTTASGVIGNSGGTMRGGPAGPAGRAGPGVRVTITGRADPIVPTAPAMAGQAAPTGRIAPIARIGASAGRRRGAKACGARCRARTGRR